MSFRLYFAINCITDDGKLAFAKMSEDAFKGKAPVNGLFLLLHNCDTIKTGTLSSLAMVAYPFFVVDYFFHQAGPGIPCLLDLHP